MRTFVERWTENTAELPDLCLGVDPSRELLRQWRLPVNADGARELGLRCVRAAQGVVSTIKPQIAYFEQFGGAGLNALRDVVDSARESGLMTIIDAKRNDIDTTVEAYAAAYFDPSSPLHVDAVTANPYLGIDALKPLFDAAYEAGGTVFVLVRTSNVGHGASLQSQRLEDGRTVAQFVADEVARINGVYGGSTVVGAVIGATVGAEAHELAERLDGAPVLAPGVGAQGAKVQAALETFPLSSPVILPVARAALAAGPDVAAISSALAGLARKDA